MCQNPQRLRNSLRVSASPSGSGSKTFPDFTEPQKMAIPQIMGGHHLLLCSPTGSGKTLTAFLTIIDDLVRKSMNGTLEDGFHVFTYTIKALYK